MKLRQTPAILHLNLALLSASLEQGEPELEPHKPLEDWVARLNTEQSSPGYPEPRGKKARDNDPKGRNSRTSASRAPQHTVLGI